MSYAKAEGKDPTVPMTGDWKLSRYIPDMAGPIDIPMRNNNIVIPNAVPLKCNGEDTPHLDFCLLRL